METNRPHNDLGAAPNPARLSQLGLYRARAASYDRELEPFEPLRVAAIDRLALQPGQTVLDVGCGTGLSLPRLLRRLGSTGHVVGIEQCAEMLAHAHARLTPDERRCVTCVHASAETAAWQGRADAALFHLTHDIVRNPAALDNVFALLRPGARVVATGLQWAPAWAWGVNCFVWGAALYSISSFEGLAQPWVGLASRLDDFVVTPVWMGGFYLASGVVRAPVTPTPSPMAALER